ncbi:MAG: hypothetical protein R3181_10925, partial [Rubricoccaceae bacterium]|nr:hypothetical protein [Rubricoccaceae bacterium]
MRLVLLAFLGLAACSATRPGGDLPPPYAAADLDRLPQYAAAPQGVPDPMPRAYDIPPSGDPALDRLLLGVVGSIDKHDWRRLAYTLDEADYAAQFALMRGGGRSAEAAVARVLEETFGLGTVGNLVFPAGVEREARPFAGLDRVRT